VNHLTLSPFLRKFLQPTEGTDKGPAPAGLIHDRESQQIVCCCRVLARRIHTADEAGAQATAPSERTRPFLIGALDYLHHKHHVQSDAGMYFLQAAMPRRTFGLCMTAPTSISVSISGADAVSTASRRRLCREVK
jgi:hypothetical protein